VLWEAAFHTKYCCSPKIKHLTPRVWLAKCLIRHWARHFLKFVKPWMLSRSSFKWGSWLRWFGHVTRMLQGNLMRRVMLATTTEKRPGCRPIDHTACHKIPTGRVSGSRRLPIPDGQIDQTYQCELSDPHAKLFFFNVTVIIYTGKCTAKKAYDRFRSISSLVLRIWLSCLRISWDVRKSFAVSTSIMLCRDEKLIRRTFNRKTLVKNQMVQYNS